MPRVEAHPAETVEPELEHDDPIQPPEDTVGDEDDDNGEPVRWVTAATFWQPTEAHIARIKLESEGIDCVIFDENLISTDWLYANAAGGIKLQVPEPLLEQARQLLARQLPAETSLKNDSGEPVFDGQDRCPQCGSEDIHSQLFSRKISYWTLLLFAFPIPFLRRGLRCASCRHEWKPPKY